MDYSPLSPENISTVLLEIESRDSLMKRLEGMRPFYPDEVVKLDALVREGCLFLPSQIKRDARLGSQDNVELEIVL